MYKSIFKISFQCIDFSKQEIHTPFINCYIIHSAYMIVNGVIYEENVVFKFENHFTKMLEGNKLEDGDHIIIELNYFYMRNEDKQILNFLISEERGYSHMDLTNGIVSKHYVEGQFSLDNGLYKNAALNFGTVLEGLLNKRLGDTPLNSFIEDYIDDDNDNKERMHSIRLLRNRVHPNRLIETEDISRKEAIEARNNLEIILKKMYDSFL